VRPIDRPATALLRHRPDRRGHRRSPAGPRSAEAHPRRGLLRQLRRRALRAALSDSHRPARPRLGRPARGDRRPVRRERPRRRACPARGLPRALLPRRPRARRRDGRASLGARHAAPRRPRHAERLRSDLPRRARGVACRRPRQARGPPAARHPVRARPGHPGRGAQPGPARERALRRQPDALGRRRHAGRAPDACAEPGRSADPTGCNLAVHARGRLGQRDRPHVPLLAVRARSHERKETGRPAGLFPREAPRRADADARRGPRSVDAARVGAAGGDARAAGPARRRPQGRPLGADARSQRPGARCGDEIPAGVTLDRGRRRLAADRRLRFRRGPVEGGRVPGKRRGPAPRRSARLRPQRDRPQPRAPCLALQLAALRRDPRPTRVPRARLRLAALRLPSHRHAPGARRPRRGARARSGSSIRPRRRSGRSSSSLPRRAMARSFS
jgi:hypothetical protein